jgi:adenylosuccinate lyase
MSLIAVSPIDGRYASKTSELQNYFSEYALMKYRVQVEIEYFIALCEMPLPQLKGIDSSLFPQFRSIYENFSVEDAERVKAIESVTNHDVKAIEYFIKEIFKTLFANRCKQSKHRNAPSTALACVFHNGNGSAHSR